MATIPTQAPAATRLLRRLIAAARVACLRIQMEAARRDVIAWDLQAVVAERNARHAARHAQRLQRRIDALR